MPSDLINAKDPTGVTRHLQCDTSGNLLTAVVASSSSSTALSIASTTALAKELQVKASAGVLYGVAVVNSGTVDQYILIHDVASTPADGQVPKLVFPLGPKASFSLFLSDEGAGFSNGIYVTNSTTLATKTQGASDVWIQATYK